MAPRVPGEGLWAAWGVVVAYGHRTLSVDRDGGYILQVNLDNVAYIAVRAGRESPSLSNGIPLWHGSSTHDGRTKAGRTEAG